VRGTRYKSGSRSRRAQVKIWELVLNELEDYGSLILRQMVAGVVLLFKCACSGSEICTVVACRLEASKER
jgi:hypothetical protein